MTVSLEDTLRRIVREELERAAVFQPDSDRVNATEAGRMLGVSPKTVLRMREDGRLREAPLPGVRRILFRRADVAALARKGQ